MQCAKHWCCSHSTQVESNIILECNINSDLSTLATTTLEWLKRRGEQNIPRRYLKNAEWVKNGPLGPGYYVGDPDDKSESLNLIPIDFNFKALQWGLTHEKDNHFILEKPAPVWYRLWIFDKERTADRSRWGPLDGTPIEEEPLKTKFKFGSDTGGDTPDPDVLIPLNQSTQEEESKLAALAQLIPAYISKPPIQPHLLAGAMAQIATTTTLTSDNLVARTLGTGTSRGGTSLNVKGILQLLFPLQHNWGNGGGDDPSEPNRWNTGKCPDQGDGGGRDGDGPGGGDGGGGGGGRPNHEGNGNPANDRALLDKLIGKEPKIFKGDWNKAEEFMTSWSVYQGIHKHTRVMYNPMQRTMLFFGYLQGPKMNLWIKKISTQLDRHIRNGGWDTDKWIWDMMLNDFAQTFQDIMSQEWAQKELFSLQMEWGELDEYTSKYQQLCELVGYYEQTGMICNQYFLGLPEGLWKSMTEFKPLKHYWNLQDWIDRAIWQHSKYLSFQAYFGSKDCQKFPKQCPSKQQWQQGFAKNLNAMDLTPGCTCAWAALTDDERATLWQEGKCFKCWKGAYE